MSSYIINFRIDYHLNVMEFRMFQIKNRTKRTILALDCTLILEIISVDVHNVRQSVHFLTNVLHCWSNTVCPFWHNQINFEVFWPTPVDRVSQSFTLKITKGDSWRKLVQAVSSSLIMSRRIGKLNRCFDENLVYQQKTLTASNRG